MHHLEIQFRRYGLNDAPRWWLTLVYGEFRVTTTYAGDPAAPPDAVLASREFAALRRQMEADSTAEVPLMMWVERVN